MDHQASRGARASSRSRKPGWFSRLARFLQVPPGARLLGRRGEKLAARYLRKQGYRIVDRNVRLHGGELDLVTVDDRMLVVVEVKTRKSPGPRSPAASVTRAKQARICRATKQYIRAHQLDKSAVRFDIVAITWPDNEDPQIEHHRDAFPWRSAAVPAMPIIPHRLRRGKGTAAQG